MTTRTDDEFQWDAPSSDVEIPDKLFFRIGDVAEILRVKPYVLRYWETEFPYLSPTKSNSGQRLYKRGDVKLLQLIKHLLYTERYSIEGARNRLKELRKKKTDESEGVSGVAFNPAEWEALREEILEFKDFLFEEGDQVFSF